MTPADTSAKAREVYLRQLAKMSPSERTRVGAALWKAAHAVQLARLRLTDPNISDAEAAYRIAATRFGERLARSIYRKP